MNASDGLPEVLSTSDQLVILQVKKDPETPRLPIHIKLKAGEAVELVNTL